MVSLCGLALSSLFVVNSKSVVHADAVNDANNQNNNAISWDSDSDKAQQVQNDSEQSPVQKADSNQQNVQSVQPSRVETSNARSSLSARSLTNQTKSVRVSNVNDVQKTNPIVINNPAGDKVNVHYVNRNGGEINDANVKDTTIDVTKTGQGSYDVPNGYTVNNPSGKYTVTGAPFNGANLKGNTWTVPAQYTNKLTTGYNDVDQILQKHGLLKDGNSVQAIVGERVGNSVGGQTQTPDEAFTIGVNTQARIPQFYNNYTYYHFKDAGSFGDRHHWQLIYKDHGGVPSAAVGSVYLDPAVPNIDAFSDSELDTMCSTIAEHTVGAFDATTPVYVDQKNVETSPAYTEEQLPVAFVDNNNNIVGMVQNYTGKVGIKQNINLTLPTGYKLADGQTMPTSVTFQKSDAPRLIKVVSNGQTNSVQNPANNQIHVNFVDQTTGEDAGGGYDIDLTKMQNGTNYYATPNGYVSDNGGAFESKHFIKTYKVPTRTRVTLSDGAHFYDSWQNYGSATPVDAINRIFKTLGASDATKLSVSLSYAPILYDDDDYTYTGVKIKNDTNGKTCIVSEDKRYASDWQRVAASALVQHLVDNDYGNAIYLTGHVILTRTPLTYSSSFTDNYHPITNCTVTVPVHKSNSKSFIDNSGNAVSAKGNTVDVALTKKSDVDPSKVDPNSPGYKITHSSATRTIQINFSDQIPASYKNIVNDKGVLTQTVNFTRDATVDTLLDPSDPNYVLSEGPWKSDNKDPNFIGFPERTLPRIPGYTLSIKPV